MTTLSNVHILVDELARTASVYAAIADVDVDVIRNGQQALIQLGDARLALEQRKERQPAGVAGITLTDSDQAVARSRLSDAKVRFDESADALTISAGQANGIIVRIGAAAPDQNPDQHEGAAASLDHVALLVADLAEASRRWEAITGQPAVHMGLHPISHGAFSAARVLLGERMIELIRPTPGMDSNVARRLAERGEGPVTLALPVDDLAAARARLESLGVRLLQQPPHWMVHPKSSGGVLVQLTPRVAH